MDTLKRSAASYPRLGVDGKTLVNLEDQILRCQQRTSSAAPASLESDSVLSAALHHAARGERIQVAPSSAASPEHAAQWQAHLSSGEPVPKPNRPHEPGLHALP